MRRIDLGLCEPKNFLRARIAIRIVKLEAFCAYVEVFLPSPQWNTILPGGTRQGAASPTRINSPGGTRQGGQPNQDKPGGTRQGGQPNQDKPGGTHQGGQPNQDKPRGTPQGGQHNQDKFVSLSVRPSVCLSVCKG